MRLPESRAVRVGLALFAFGLAFIVVDVLVFAIGDRNTPLWLNLCCVLAPAGFAVVVWSGLRSGREEQRRAAQELGDQRPAGHRS